MRGSAILEIVWTLIPAVILTFIAFPTVAAIFRTQAAPPKDALRVEVVGQQWWWEFQYPELGVITANELHLPAGRPVSLRARTRPTSSTASGCPQLGGKRDVVPGRVNRIMLTPDAPGEYSGQCAEYCGMSHANMRFRVIVHDAGGFDEWVAKPAGAAADPARRIPGGRRAQALPQSARASAATRSRACPAGGIGPDLTHFGSRKTIAGGILRRTRPRTWRKWIENRRRMKPGVADAGPGADGREQVEGARRLPPEPQIEMAHGDTRVRACPAHADRAAEARGLWSWLTTVDHKRIGILYGVVRLHLLPDRRASRRSSCACSSPGPTARS